MHFILMALFRLCYTYFMYVLNTHSHWRTFNLRADTPVAFAGYAKLSYIELRAIVSYGELRRGAPEAVWPVGPRL